jgi:hypothetical protein
MGRDVGASTLYELYKKKVTNLSGRACPLRKKWRDVEQSGREWRKVGGF